MKWSRTRSAEYMWQKKTHTQTEWEHDVLYFCSEECSHKYLTNNNSKIEKGVKP